VKFPLEELVLCQCYIGSDAIPLLGLRPPPACTGAFCDLAVGITSQTRHILEVLDLSSVSIDFNAMSLLCDELIKVECTVLTLRLGGTTPDGGPSLSTDPFSNLRSSSGLHAELDEAFPRTCCSNFVERSRLECNRAQFPSQGEWSHARHRQYRRATGDQAFDRTARPSERASSTNSNIVTPPYVSSRSQPCRRLPAQDGRLH
jgi:hypothetical protein